MAYSHSQEVEPHENPCEAPPQCGFEAIDSFQLFMENTAGGPYSYPGFGGGCALHDPNWFAFVAGANQLDITIIISNCSGGSSSLQFTMYSGDPSCNGGEVDGLDVEQGNCQCIDPGTYQFNNISTIPGFTYYMVFDGCAGALCDVEVIIDDGGEPPMADDPQEPVPISFPEFDGPDTVCVGANNVSISLPELPFGASRLIWTIDGTEIEGDVGSPSIDIPSSLLQSPGTIEVCVKAINDCDESNSVCKNIEVAFVDPVYEEFTVCEGDDFTWDNGSINTDNITENTTIEQSTTRDGTAGCSYEAFLTLHIINENNENPTQVVDAICFPETYSHPSGYTTPIAVEDEEYVTLTPEGCDTFFNFTVDVVGGDFNILPPEECNGDGTLTIESLFTPIDPNTVPLNDPDLTVTYEWTVNGNVIGGDAPTLTIDQQTLLDYPFGSYQLRVEFDYPNLDNNCVYTSNALILEAEDYIPSIDSISGPGTLCFESNGTYEVYFQDPENQYFEDDVTAWFWEAPIGITIDGNGGNPIMVTVGPNAQNGDICVEIQTDCGFTDDACIPVEINNPIDPEIGTVNNDPCTFTYSFSPETADEGQWIIVSQPANSQVDFSDITDPNASVDVDSSGTYEFAWREGVPGCEKFDTVALTFTGGPEITGISEICNDPPIDYIVTFEISGGTPPYSVVVGDGSISGNTFTSDPIPQMTDYSFQVEDANGCLSDLIEGNKICDCDTDAAMMESDTLHACGDNECITAMPMGAPGLDGDDIVQFALHEGSGNSLQDVIEIKNDETFCFRSGMNLEQVYYISRIVGSNDGNDAVDLDDGCLSVAPGQPVIWHEQPEADAGVTQIDSCGKQADLSANPSVGSGSWTHVSGPGTANFSSPDDPNASVSVDSFGTYIFEWREDNRGCVDADEVTVTFHDPPRLVPASLSAECLPSLDYVLTFQIEGGTPPYTLLSGAGNLNGSTYRDTLANLTPYDISITDAQGCGPLEISGMHDCICTSVAGMMATETLDTCSSQCVTAEHLGLDTLDDDDAAVFILHDADSDMLGTIIATNQSGTFCYEDYAGELNPGDTYYISYVVGNDDGNDMVDLSDPCLAVAPGQPVVFYEAADVDAGADDMSCGFTYSLQASQSDGSGSWSMINGPGTASFNDDTNLSTDVSVTEYGSYCFQWTGTYEGCVSEDMVCIEFLDAPAVDPATIEYDCNALNTEYTVSFTIAGGDDNSYAVDGDPGTLSGNEFTSDPIPSGEPYTFLVYDGNRCDTSILTDGHICQCISEAGTMGTDTVSACPGENITVGGAQNPVLDDEDIVIYVLHEGASDSIVDKIAENDAPGFDFDPAVMNYNQVYYVSSVVGNDDGSGSIHSMDACRVVSEGTPVIWYENPTAAVDPSIDTITCEQLMVLLDGSPSDDVTGDGLDFIWTDSDGMNVGNGIQVSVDEPGEYTLTVIDRGSGCEDRVTVNVPLADDTPFARILEPGTITCDQSSVLLDGSESSQGSVFSYDWTSDPPGLDISDPTVSSPVVAEGGTYILTVTNDANGCTSTASVAVSVDTVHPVAEAVVNGELNCSTEEVQIDATGSSQGSEFSYQWTPSDLSGLQPVVSQPGQYMLEVENNENGCSSSVSVEVEQDTNIIRDASVDMRNPGCDGEATGQIEVTDIVGGTAPYTYTLNGGEQQNGNGIFQALGEGVFEVEIIDAKGCTFTTDEIDLVEPPPLEVYLPPSVKIELGDSIELIPEILPVDRDLASINWTSDPTDSLLDCTSCRNLVVHPDELTLYELTVVDENGCIASALTSVAVEIPRNVYVPNAFSPNGDGVNDRFFLQSKEGEIRNIKSMAIYDRWGNRVYERNDVPPNSSELGWNGTKDGQELSPAVFVYVFEVVYFDGVSEQIKGDVTLLR